MSSPLPVLRRFLPGVAAALAIVLAACTPEYDWRELPVAEGRARAAFPARVQTEQRPVTLDGRQLPFTLTTAAVGEALFAVGHAPLPADVRGRVADEARLARALTRTLYANLGRQPPEDLPPPGKEIRVEAEIDGEPALLMARVMVQGDMLIEAVAMGPSRSLPIERAQDFVRSLRPAP